MNSKQRVYAAINHQKVDYVPIGELEIDAPIVEKVLGRKTYYGSRLPLLKAYWEGRRDEAVDSMKRDYVEFICKTGFDIAEIRLVPDKCAEFIPLKQINSQDYADEYGNVLRWSPETLEIILISKGSKPLQIAKSPCAFEKEEFHTPSESELEFAGYVMKKLGDTHFIIGPNGNSIGKPATEYGWPVSMAAPFRKAGGLNDILEKLIDDPEGLKEIYIQMAKDTRRAIEYWKNYGCDTIWTARDYGYNKGLFMSPKQFDEVFFPGLKLMAKQFHDFNLPHIFHSCGNNREIWHRLVDAGIDVYQSIQDEEPLDILKEKHGSKLTLWGGVSSRLLETGTPEQIREQVKRALDIASDKGGFILGSTHSLGPGVKLENFMAMLDAWHKYR